MRRLLGICLLSALAAPAWAALKGDGLIPCPASAISPHIAFGGSWSTTIYINAVFPYGATSVTLQFFDSTRKPLQAPVSTSTGVTGTMSQIQVTVPPEGIAINLLGTGATTSTGWVAATCTAGADLQMYEVFRSSVPGRPDFEASTPFTLVKRSGGNPPQVRYLEFPFDNRNGLETGFAALNTGPPLGLDGNQGVGVTCYAGSVDYGSNSALLDRSTVYGAWVLSALLPGTIGKMGVCRVYGILGADGRPGAIALRFTQGGAFSTLPVVSDD